MEAYGWSCARSGGALEKAQKRVQGEYVSIGHRRAYGGHTPTSTVTQIKEDCTNIPRQAIIHCVSTRFSTLMSFAYSKSSLIIGAFSVTFFRATVVVFFVRLLYFIRKTRHGESSPVANNLRSHSLQ